MDNKIEISVLVSDDFDLNILTKNSKGIDFLLVRRTTETGFSSGIPNELIDFVVSVSGDITLGILGNFIYDQLKGKVEKLWINDKKTTVDRIEINNVIQNITIINNVTVNNNVYLNDDNNVVKDNGTNQSIDQNT